MSLLLVHAYMPELGPAHELLYACEDMGRVFIYVKKGEEYTRRRIGPDPFTAKINYKRY